MKKILQSATIAGVFTLASTGLQAAYITGIIGFGGFEVTLLDNANLNNDNIALRDINETSILGSPMYSTTTSFADTDALRFEHSNFSLFGDSEAIVNNATGDFLSLVNAESGIVTANYADFAFNPYLIPNSVNPLWHITLANNDDLSFTMNSVVLNSHTSGISLSGLGTISGGGFLDTEGTWEFSTQTGSFTWSASTQPVPEPSTYAMFGTAFAILGFVGYRKRRA